MKNRKEIIKEIQEIKRRLRLVEKSAAGLKKAKTAPPEEALKRKFPTLRVDPELLKCVGIDPPLSLQREKQALRDAIDVFYESK